MALGVDASSSIAGDGTAGPYVFPAFTTTQANTVLYLSFRSNSNNATPLASTVTSPGLTWIKRDSQLPAASARLESWYAIASSILTSHVVTVTVPASSFFSGAVVAISGADTTTPFDTNGGLPAHNTSGALAISTTRPRTILLGTFQFAAAGTPTAGTGFTILSSGGFFLLEYQIVTAAQSSTTLAVGTGAGTDQRGGLGDAISEPSTGTNARVSTLTMEIMASPNAHALVSTLTMEVMYSVAQAAPVSGVKPKVVIMG